MEHVKIILWIYTFIIAILVGLSTYYYHRYRDTKKELAWHEERAIQNMKDDIQKTLSSIKTYEKLKSDNKQLREDLGLYKAAFEDAIQRKEDEEPEV